MSSRRASLWKRIMKDSSYFVDTNVFLRLIVKDDAAKFAHCQALIKLITQKQIAAVTSSLVLAEVVWTSQRFYKLAKSEAIKIFEGIISIKNLKFEDQVNLAAALQFYRTHSVKFADCLIASHPQILSREMTIISYDRDFDALGIKRIEPGNVI